MELTGEISPGTEQILRETEPAFGKIESDLKSLPQEIVKKVAIQHYNTISSASGTIVAICKQPRATSHSVCVLLRSLLDGMVSTFAFCKKPEERAPLYWNYNAVLDWKFVLADRRNFGCPFVPGEGNSDYMEKFKTREESATAKIRELGGSYLKPGKTLDEAMQSNAPWKYFRDSWYPESRRKILEQEEMSWVYDVMYSRLSCAVHSDSAAVLLFSRTDRDTTVNFCFLLLGASLYRLIESLRINVPSRPKGIFRTDYECLQGKKKAQEKS